MAVRGLVSVGEQPAERGQRTAMVALLVIDQADRVRATRSVGSVFEPVGGEHRVEHAHAR